MRRHGPTPALVLALSTAACASTGSTYDQAWVSAELGRAALHDGPVRAVAAPPREFAPSLPAKVTGVGALTEDEAVSVALWNSAQFRADLAQLGMSRADLADAAALPNPNLSFLFPVSTRQVELSVQYPISQLLQRPWRVAAAKLDVERAARALVQSGLDAVRDVRIAWAELAAARQRRGLRQRAEQLGQGWGGGQELLHVVEHEQHVSSGKG
ncbi:MAG TPA: TolC family protein, partial [Polyangiaceae bacterium]|nr:TolC family protein [Polyangiaceae bacterium]